MLSAIVLALLIGYFLKYILPLFMICLGILGVVKPKTIWLDLIAIILIFCFVVSFVNVDLLSYVIGCVIVLCIAALLDKFRWKGVFTYAVLIFAITNMVMINNLVFPEQQQSSVSIQKSLFNSKLGVKGQYCNTGVCKKYSIPKIYNNISMLENSYCPYFFVDRDGKRYYIDQNNKQLFEEYDKAELLGDFTVSPFQPSQRFYTLDNYYFKIFKGSKVGLYEVIKKDCNSMKLIADAVYDDIRIIKANDEYQLLIMNKGGLNDVYLSFFRKDFRKVYSELKDFQLLVNENNGSVSVYNPKTKKNEVYDKHRLKNYLKVIADGKIEYMGKIERLKPKDKSGWVYEKIHY